MSKFRGRGRRWRKSNRRARGKENKRFYLANGWVEVSENILVPASSAKDYPPYIPTHLGGKAEKRRCIKLTKPQDWPRRSEVKKLKIWAKRENYTIRQLLGDGGW